MSLTDTNGIRLIVSDWDKIVFHFGRWKKMKGEDACILQSTAWRPDFLPGSAKMQSSDSVRVQSQTGPFPQTAPSDTAYENTTLLQRWQKMLAFIL